MKIKTSGLLTALTLALYPVLGLGAGATANTRLAPAPAPMEIAQANAPNCRVPNRLQDIYSDASVEGFSRALLTIEANTPFYLDRNADGSLVLQNGFARGRTNNTVGWMITRYLTSIPGCGGTTPPPPATLCSRALVDLTVRRDPALRPNNVLGTLYAGAEVTVQNEFYDSASGRTWIQFPYLGGLGWAAESGGFAGGGRNFSARYRCNR